MGSPAAVLVELLVVLGVLLAFPLLAAPEDVHED